MCNAQLAVFFHETGIVLEISMVKLSVFSSFFVDTQENPCCKAI